MNKTINLSVPNLQVEPILSNLRECLESGWISTGGRFIPEFESKVAKYVGVSDAVGVQSGTGAIHVALQVLGVSRDDEVIVPTVTFIASVNPVTYLGAIPIFMDCDDSFCIDPVKLEQFCREECDIAGDKLINKKTKRHIKALVAVHIFGNMADMEKIMTIAGKYKLKVLDEAAEALGTYYTEGPLKGRYAGTLGDIGIYSFNANKTITTGGGGMIVSRNQEYLDHCRFLSTQAKTNSLYFIHDEIGYNYRMLNLQAALGTVQIDHLEEFIKIKDDNYEYYKTKIERIPGLSMMPFRDGTRPNRWFYSILIDKETYGLDRDELLTKLNDVGIQSRPIWKLNHLQKPYINNIAYKMKKSLYYYDRILNVPCSTNLTFADIDIVVEKLKECAK